MVTQILQSNFNVLQIPQNTAARSMQLASESHVKMQMFAFSTRTEKYQAFLKEKQNSMFYFPYVLYKKCIYKKMNINSFRSNCFIKETWVCFGKDAYDLWFIL